MSGWVVDDESGKDAVVSHRYRVPRGIAKRWTQQVWIGGEVTACIQGTVEI
jgi:hypothetical protein